MFLHDSLLRLRKSQFLFEELVKRDFKKKYKGTMLGIGWSVLQPLLMLLVLKLVFEQFFGRTVSHYTTYLFCGQLLFHYFSEAVGQSMKCLVSEAGIYGKIKVRGSVASLIELASGFDKDLTVRENTYLRGAILGYTRTFMNETYDQIIDFAELRKFQDTPFRQLSSGMKSRLAFSIASLVKPDILILDEVLSVGDAGFKAKSAGKMKEMMSGGVTTILVSHSIGQIRKLCNKVLWLHKGQQIAFSEDVAATCDQFEKFLAGEAELPSQDSSDKSSR